jgi:hypothetical protein
LLFSHGPNRWSAYVNRELQFRPEEKAGARDSQAPLISRSDPAPRVIPDLLLRDARESIEREARSAHFASVLVMRALRFRARHARERAPRAS